MPVHGHLIELARRSITWKQAAFINLSVLHALCKSCLMGRSVNGMTHSRAMHKHSYLHGACVELAWPCSVRPSTSIHPAMLCGPNSKPLRVAARPRPLRRGCQIGHAQRCAPLNRLRIGT
eukprot:2391052-Pleurochrysis_carterae.AAC.2